MPKNIKSISDQIQVVKQLLHLALIETEKLELMSSDGPGDDKKIKGRYSSSIAKVLAKREKTIAKRQIRKA